MKKLSTIILGVVLFSCQTTDTYKNENGKLKTVAELNFFIYDLCEQLELIDSLTTIKTDLLSFQRPLFEEQYDQDYFVMDTPFVITQNDSKFMVYQDSIFGGLSLNSEIFDVFKTAKSPVATKFSCPVFNIEDTKAVIIYWRFGTGYFIYLEKVEGKWEILTSRIHGYI